MISQQFDFTIEQGKTFRQVVRWEAPPFIYKPITGISNAAPAVVDCAAHGVPDGWRVAVVSVEGMEEINASQPPRIKEFVQATVIDLDTLELNTVNASKFSPYVSGGYIQYYTPVDLTGFTGRMSIKDRVGGTEILSLTTANGGVVIDVAAHTITLVLTDAQTAALTPRSRMVYDLELVSAGGEVTGLLYGNVTLAREVTT